MSGLVNGTLIGNVGNVGQMRYTQSGVAVMDFSVAVNKVTGSGDNKRETTTWVKVTAWRTLAEIMGQHLQKGAQVAVTFNEMKASAYSDKSGQPAASLEVTAESIIFVGPKRDRDGGADNYTPPGFGEPEPDSLGDIPF